MRTNNSILPLLKFALAALVLGVAVAAQQKPVALRGGKLLTVTHGTIENGVLIIENGKIAAVGAPASVKIPQDARLIDVSGMTVYPGLIDSETQLGLTEIPAEEMTNDFIELSDEIMPHMHVYDAFHAESELIPVTRYNGVTNAIVAPGNLDTLPGQDSFVQLAGKTQGDFLLVRDIAMPLNFSGEHVAIKARSTAESSPLREWVSPRNCGRYFLMPRIMAKSGRITRKENRIREEQKQRSREGSVL